jgi:hypothetical protein
MDGIPDLQVYTWSDEIPPTNLDPPQVQLMIINAVTDRPNLDVTLNLPVPLNSFNLGYKTKAEGNVEPGTYALNVVDPATPEILLYSADITIVPKQRNLLVLMGTVDDGDAYPISSRLITGKTKR